MSNGDTAAKNGNQENGELKTALEMVASLRKRILAGNPELNIGAVSYNPRGRFFEVEMTGDRHGSDALNAALNLKQGARRVSESWLIPARLMEEWIKGAAEMDLQTLTERLRDKSNIPINGGIPPGGLENSTASRPDDHYYRVDDITPQTRRSDFFHNKEEKEQIKVHRTYALPPETVKQVLGLVGPSVIR